MVAPSRIHCSIMATSASLGCGALSGGIALLFNTPVMRPLAALMPAFVSNRIRLDWRVGPWHWKQYVAKKGFACVSKSILAATAVGCAAGATAVTTCGEGVGVGAATTGAGAGAGVATVLLAAGIEEDEDAEFVAQALSASASEPVKTKAETEGYFMFLLW